MSYTFGSSSRKKLDTCHPLLVKVAEEGLLLSPYDITIVHGWRSEVVQDALLASGASTKGWPNSKHNATDRQGKPFSEAFDFAPWVGGGIPWNETHIFAVIAGVFMAVANDHGIILRWGGDWDGDGNTKEHILQDWGHIEVIL